MKVKVVPNSISGEILANPSKSYAHRVILCAALANGKSRVDNLVFCDDVRTTVDIVEKLGAKVEKIGNRLFEITPIDRECLREKEVELFANESGSTLRFILPILCALGVKAVVDGKDGLRKRPLNLLVDCLNRYGAKIKGDRLPVITGGKLTPAVYEIDAGQSSQNLTGLLYALSLLDAKSELVLKNETVSKGYIDITLSVLSDFGANIEKTERGFVVYPAEFKPLDTSIEGDYSSLAFPVALAATAGKVKVSGMNPDSLQGDRAILDVLTKMGAKISWQKDAVTVEKSPLSAVELDGRDIPDLLPIVAVLCARAQGISKIYGVDRLKIKESNRISAICDLLRMFDVKHFYANDCLTIYGRMDKKEPLGEINGYNDHRIVMSGVVMAIAFGSEITVTDARAVDKSYPHFFEDMITLGGEKIVELF